MSDPLKEARAEVFARVQRGACIMDAPDGPECWCGRPSEAQSGECGPHARQSLDLARGERAEADLTAVRRVVLQALADVHLGSEGMTIAQQKAEGFDKVVAALGLK